MNAPEINIYTVNFFDCNGKCYLKNAIAVHVDVTKYTTLIDFIKTPLKNESSGLFNTYDELERIDVIGNLLKLSYISGQTITIIRNDNGAL